MRRFRFKLEAVRELREQAETSAKEALARELALGQARERELADATARLADARRTCVVAPDAPVDAADLRTRRDYIERRELERAVAALNAKTQAERIEAGRRVLALAAREREAVERLRRWQERDHARAAERAEQRILEDIGLRIQSPFGQPGQA
jgi:flagellar export protein FliJ